MKSIKHSTLLLASAVVLGAASFAVVAAPPADKGKPDRSDFVRGNANSKSKPVDLPKTEREAVAEARLTPAGIVEMQLPEDRMVNLVAVKRADGTVEMMHLDDDAAHDHATPAPAKPQGEIE
ncbi:MAG: hypothetical protein M3Q40_03815 [Pseudomonadota bacterium]|nr:hypothetical protein [Pseudomonadota bacterium]